MKIVVHDYSGHPFQVQLSRELARRGHAVTHLFFSEFQTPRGNLVRQPGDPAGFDVRGLSIGEPFQKASFVKRRAQEQRYGRLCGAEIERLKPDVVISSNAPLDSQKAIQAASARAGAGFVFWVQDLYGEAIRRILSGKWPVIGDLVGRFYQALEMGMLRRSDEIVVITEDFIPILTRAGVPATRITSIENWAPLDEIVVAAPANRWGAANGFHGRRNIVYAGTIGYKHNPGVLLKLAAETEAFVTVFSEGVVADTLAEQGRGLPNFAVRPWVPFADLPEMLASADMVVAFVEPDAGICSVPSKVLTYLAAGRPILAAIPDANLATRMIRRAGAGVVVEPGDDAGLVAAAKRLLADPAALAAMGPKGRAYAEQAFDITALGDRFERIVAAALPKRAAA